MSKKTSILAIPYFIPTLLLTMLWFGGSAYWYACEIHELCESSATKPLSVTVVGPKENAPAPAEPTPVTYDTAKTLTVYFNADSSAFADNQWQVEMAEIIKYLLASPTQTVQIAGYAASADTPADETSLSKDRALAIAAYMVQEGVPLGQIETTVKAYDDAVNENTTKSDRALNRRAVVSFN